ncbi:MAG: TIGR03087 family PEP-CTERM/XrtA system glycosyltransferase [Planctomycetes bacterium]|nr:TIGR03087 family PEP-CTERM/XrtA system glycosyltransferase [Planctomycetota bacterium]
MFLCHRIPFPPDKGDKIRSYHLLTSLVRRGNVDLVTHVDDPRDLRHVQLLRDLCRTVDVFPLNPVVGYTRALVALATGASLSVAYMTRRSAARRVRALLAERSYDLVVGYSSQVAAYLPKDLDVPVVFDLVDVDSAKWAAYGDARDGLRAFIPRLEERRVGAFEKRIADGCARVVVATQREANVLERRVGRFGTVPIVNGITAPDAAPDHGRRDAGLVVFVGMMDYPPNVDAVHCVADNVWPRVREAVPGARFRIVGRAPIASVRALAARPGIEVTGEVPDLSAHLGTAAVALIPLRIARGIQNKVLEAMAWGLPVVASPAIGASLHDDAAAALSCHAEDADLADEVVRLLGDQQLRQTRGDAGRAFVARHHDWSTVDARWAELIAGVLGEPVS